MCRRIKVFKATKLKQRKSFENKIFTSKTKLINSEKLESLKINGRMSLEVFKDNISLIFPLILLRVSEGVSIRAIEREIGVTDRTIETLSNTYPRVHRAIKAARSIKSDSLSLADILS